MENKIAITALMIAVHLTGAAERNIVLPYRCEDLDVVFVVDGSGSVGVHNFETVRKWLIASVTNIHQELGPRVQLGVLEYSFKNQFETPFRLGDCSTLECMTSSLKNMSYFKSTTYTYSALKRTVEEEFPYSKRANYSRKLIILITDGKADDGQHLPQWSDEAASMNITTFAVGVGKFNEPELKIVARRDENIYNAADFEKLPVVVSTMAKKFCEDNNECDLQAHNCNANMTCINHPGNFSCECLEGYNRDTEGHCIDDDECLTDVCFQKKCSNIPGAFSCSCDVGFLEEEKHCSECTCEPKEGYHPPTSECSDGNFNCEYRRIGGGVTSCVVLNGSAFGAVLGEIRDWSDNSPSVKNSSQVVEKVKKIDEKIKCAAAATAGSNKVVNRTSNIEVASLEIKMSSTRQEPVINFSRSIVDDISVDGLDVGRGVLIEFFAPKRGIDLLIKQPEKLSTTTTTTKRYVFTGTSPILSLSMFSGKNMTYRNDVKLGFDIEIAKDFFNFSESDDISTDPEFPDGYVSEVGYSCMFIDTVTAQMSDEGCETNDYVIGSKVTCRCNHSTMFAVLLTVDRIKIPDSVKVVSYIAEALSVLLLIITLVVLTNVRPQVRGDRISVQICLTISLLFLHIFMLLHDLALRHDISCQVIAVLIHFLLLASAMWMLMEGVTLVIKTNDQTIKYLTDGNRKKFGIIRQIVGWGVPVLIVVIAAAVGFTHNTYMGLNPAYVEQMARDEEWNLSDAPKYNFCWLSQIVLIWAVIVPVGIMLLLNLIILVRMAFYIHKMSAEGDQFKPTHGTSRSRAEINHAKVTFKAILVLLPVLGIAWILAFLTNINYRNSSVVFLYINAILNGLQGVFLFIVYCVIGREVRKVVSIKYKRRQTVRESSRKSSHSKHSNGDRPKKAASFEKTSGKTKSTALPLTSRDGTDKKV